MLFLVLAVIVAGLGIGDESKQKPPLRLKAGDKVSITSPYGGEFTIMDDGAIYGRGFGRIVLEGKTWSEAQGEVRTALQKFVKPDEVFLVISEVRRDFVYLAGTPSGRGFVELTPGLTLRKLVSAVPIDENPDLIEIHHYRKGEKINTLNLGQLLGANEPLADIPLQADDVITLHPVAYVRVWVLGRVNKPGQIRLPAGADIYQAIATAGGIRELTDNSNPSIEEDLRIIVRRGPETLEFPARPDGNAVYPIEAGDTITVVAPEAVRITVMGYVEKPGEFVLRGRNSLLDAVATAGGITEYGSLSRVLVFRNGEAYQVDVSGPARGVLPDNFKIESGDLIYVPRNERNFIVLGEVSKPGKYIMEDGKEYRLTDALASAGGLSSKGTLRRVYLARPDSSGKVHVKMIHLDKFLKDGDLASNPVIQPGDCILFGQPRGLTLASASSFLSSALLLDSLLNSRR